MGASEVGGDFIDHALLRAGQFEGQGLPEAIGGSCVNAQWRRPVLACERTQTAQAEPVRHQFLEHQPVASGDDGGRLLGAAGWRGVQLPQSLRQTQSALARQQTGGQPVRQVLGFGQGLGHQLAQLFLRDAFGQGIDRGQGGLGLARLGFGDEAIVGMDDLQPVEAVTNFAKAA